MSETKRPKKPKFDSSICETCQWYWGKPSCHFHGKRIFYGECIEYRQKEKPPTKAELEAERWERYQDEWN